MFFKHKNIKKPIQGVLLDLDGTLIDGFSPIVAALNQTREEFGMQPLPHLEIQRHTGRGGGSVEAMFGKAWREAQPRFLELHDRVFLSQTSPMPGAEELLDFLVVNGLVAGIVTNKGQERAETQLQHLGWHGKLAVVVGYVPGKPSKPSPKPVKLACKLMQIDVRRSLFIGDGPADMQAASRAGSLPIGIADSFSEEELRESGAALCFANLMDIQAWMYQQIA